MPIGMLYIPGSNSGLKAVEKCLVEILLSCCLSANSRSSSLITLEELSQVSGADWSNLENGQNPSWRPLQTDATRGLFG